MPRPGTCRICGCTDRRACLGGCYWVDGENTLCSACEGRLDGSFTDADFFRRCVAAETTAPLLTIEGVSDRIIALASRIPSRSPTDQTEQLIYIAALCERAAVDLTIPNSRAASKQGRARRSARAASKKGNL